MALIMQVDQKRCTGCGHCLEVCPTGAIRLVGGVAVIEESICQGCLACLKACPNGAILAVEEVPAEVPAPAPSQTSAPPRPAAKVLPLLGTALAFLGREIVPQVMAALLEKQSRRGAKPAMTGLLRRYRWRLRRRGWR